ncbi:rhodanase [Aureococcus anophagefferens]|uniref:Rhodanase n=1 Tax=Aureococcus anophagefferens TaxID=44056 RepID=A0ABR1G3Y3_AURAN
MSLSFRLLDCTFAKPCQYFISLQLDDHKKRLRTKVSDETAKPAFDQVFDLGDFEEDFAELTGATRRLTLDAFVVLGREGASSTHQLLGTASVALPAAPASPGASPPRVEHHNLTFTRKETKTNGEIPVGRFRLEIADGRAAWDDRVVFPVGALDGAAPVHGDLATYPAALDRARRPSLRPTALTLALRARRGASSARARCPSRARGAPARAAVVGPDGARVGAFAARVVVETREGLGGAPGKETPRTAATPPVAAAARRAATPDAALSTSTDWEPPPGPRSGDGAPDARARARRRRVAQKQLAIQRLVGELEARGAALRTCGGEIDALRRRGAALEADKGALAAQIAAAAEAKDREWRGLERLLADGGDLERFDGAGAATKFQILAHLCTSLRDENAALRRADEDRAAAERKLGDAEARHAHLQRAHTAQSAFIQKLQADRAKVDAYKTTIAMQEQVIAKLEHVVTAKLKEIVDRRQAELALKRDEPPVVAPDPATERKLAAALDEKRGLEFLVEAKDQRVKVLEDQLLVKASEAAQEIAKLNLKIFELEVQQSDTLGRAAPR